MLVGGREGRYLLNIKPGPDIHNHFLSICQFAGHVEGGRQWDQDLCF